MDGQRNRTEAFAIGTYFTGDDNDPRSGRCQWLQAAVADALARLREHGLEAPGVSLRQVRGKLWEIRVSAGGAVRIFYYVLVSGAEETLVLLHA